MVAETGDRQEWRIVSTWPAPSTATPVHATVTVPGSKSQTNRALVLAALAVRQSPSTLSGALRSRDTDLMIGALQALGLSIEASDTDNTELTISGSLAPQPGVRIDCGLAGTVLRFVPPVAALSTETVTFDSASASTATACPSRSEAAGRCAAAPSRSTRRGPRSLCRACCSRVPRSPTA
jgi:hypothetical protein